MLGYGTGDCPAWSGGGAKGALDACGGGGCAKSGVQKCRLRRKQMHAQMPWGALSGARWLPSIGNVFGELASTPVFEGIIAENTCIYVQYTCIYGIYMHIHTYTCIYDLRSYVSI